MSEDPRPTDLTRWGRPAHPVTLSPRARRYLRDALGDATATRTGPTVPAVPSSRLSAAAGAALAAAVGEHQVLTDPATRRRHAAGWSYADVLERREGPLPTPDAVVRPATAEDVVRVLAACSDHQVAVVPYGGGTSVVGGVRPDPGPFAAVVALALDRMDDVLDIDAESMTVTVQPGITGPALERHLGRHGLTVGHFPQSFERATVGGWVATRSAGQESSGYGRSDEMVVALQVATPRGLLRLGRAPMSAAGPDLRQLFVGSEGAFGVVAEVTLRVREAPADRHVEAWMVPDLAAGLAAVRRLARTPGRPDVVRLSDPDETAASLALSGPSGWKARALGAYLGARRASGGCLLVLAWSGEGREIRGRRHATVPVLKAARAVTLGGGAGQSWERGRFAGPYQRDVLIDRGYLVETLETATSWRDLAALRDGVRRALTEALTAQGTPPIVLCHVSHVYETGASLYFTVVARRPAGRDAGQWWAAKQAASRAIVAAGATITHHHGVGADHAPYLADEVGELGVEVLQAVKAVVDPAGVLNPGKLVPAPTAMAPAPAVKAEPAVEPEPALEPEAAVPAEEAPEPPHD